MFKTIFLGACAIAEAVQCLPDLEELDLGDCLVRTEGALKLARALRHCEKIKRINFAFGEIRLNGALALMEALSPVLYRLEQLDLNGNKFGEEGCENIKEYTDLGKIFYKSFATVLSVYKVQKNCPFIRSNKNCQFISSNKLYIYKIQQIVLL